MFFSYSFSKFINLSKYLGLILFLKSFKVINFSLSKLYFLGTLFFFNDFKANLSNLELIILKIFLSIFWIFQ